MVERYSFIIWMHSGELSALDYSNIICNISDLLNLFFGESVINFKAAYSKRTATPISMNRENMLQEMEAARRKRKDSVPLRFQYFSSLADDSSLGVQLSFDDLHFTSENIIIIHFPIVCPQIGENYQGLWHLFQAIINEAHPYYAFMSNSLDHRLSTTYWTTKPTYVHTFNYYANDTIELIGKRRLLREGNIEKTENGIFLKLLDEPLSIHNPSHLQIQEEISKRLGLI